MAKRENKKSLAAKLKMSVDTLNKKIEIFCSEEIVKKEFGKYLHRGFSYKQLKIIERETGEKIFTDETEGKTIN